jgi:hypothetical protein
MPGLGGTAMDANLVRSAARYVSLLGALCWAADAPAKVSGQYSFGEQTVAITHAYLLKDTVNVEVGDHPGPARHLLLILAPFEIPPDQLAPPKYKAFLGQQKQMSLVVDLDSSSDSSLEAQEYSSVIDKHGSPKQLSIEGQVVLSKRSDGAAAGSIKRELSPADLKEAAEHEAFFGHPDLRTLQAEFDVALAQPVDPTARLAEGSASGNFQLGDKTLPLSSAYIVVFPKDDLIDAGKTVLILTTYAVPPEQRMSPARLRNYVHEQHQPAVLVAVDDSGDGSIAGTVEGLGPDSFNSFSSSNHPGEYLHTYARSDQAFAGEAATVSDDWKFNAAFRAAVVKAPVPQQELSGAAAEASEPGKHALLCLQAQLSCDTAKMQPLFTADFVQHFQQIFSSPQGAQARAECTQASKALSGARRQTVVQTFADATRVSFTLKNKHGGDEDTSLFNLRLAPDGGQLKCSAWED